jgi:hypothetical protein
MIQSVLGVIEIVPEEIPETQANCSPQRRAVLVSFAKAGLPGPVNARATEAASSVSGNSYPPFELKKPLCR